VGRVLLPIGSEESANAAVKGSKMARSKIYLSTEKLIFVQRCTDTKAVSACQFPRDLVRDQALKDDLKQ
jgi:hypothetical protein